MTLPIEAAALVLVAAFLHASWNALLKAGHDRLVVLAWGNAVGILISLIIAPFVPLPLAASWPYLAASVVLHTGYYFFLIRAYRVGDLSHVYPLARGLSPMDIVKTLQEQSVFIPTGNARGIGTAGGEEISSAFLANSP